MRVGNVALGLCFAAVAVLSTDALARTETRASDVRVEPQQFAEYRSWVEKELRSGETLVELSRVGREEVQAILARMANMLAEVDTVEQLETEQKLDLYNDQERLRVLLGQAEEDSRLQCRRVKTVGTHLVKNICQTVAHWRRLADESRDFMRRHQMGPKLDRPARPRGSTTGGSN
jgi:hypothetical protein